MDNKTATPDLFLKHFQVLARHHAPVLLYGGRPGLERALSCLGNTALAARLGDLLVAAASEPCPPEIAGVPVGAGLESVDPATVRSAVLVDADLEAIKLSHMALAPFKARGALVVSAFERLIFDGPPRGVVSGINYAGMFTLAAQFARDRPATGDYMEFGVFDGRSVSLAYHTIGRLLPHARLFAFDTFEGIRGATDQEKALYWDGNYYSNVETFWHNMRVAGVPKERVVAVQGDFRETLADGAALRAAHRMEFCSVAHIDCDVYEGALAALHFLTPLLGEGSLLLFDEYDQWGGDDGTGERRAAREWLAANPAFHLEPYRQYAWAARSFIVHVR